VARWLIWRGKKGLQAANIQRQCSGLPVRLAANPSEIRRQKNRAICDGDHSEGKA
jgi:hypothetical protein